MEVVKFLVQNKATLETPWTDGRSPLWLVSEMGYLDIVKCLVQNKANIEAPFTDGRSPLYIACQLGHLEIVKFLVESGANIEALRDNGSSPLFVACQEGHLEVVKFLIQNKANIEALDNDGDSPLLAATYRGNKEIVSFLISKNANINCVNKKNQNYVDMIKLGKEDSEDDRTNPTYDEILHIFKNFSIQVTSSAIKKSNEGSRFIVNNENGEPKSSLAPFVLLDKNDTILSFEESVKFGLQDKFDELCFESNLPFGEDLFQNTKNEYGLTKEEVLAIYFYTLEWSEKTSNLYSCLNKDISSTNRDASAPKWKYYLHYLFSAVRKLPKFNGTVYRGVRENLVAKYPEKFVKGAKIVWNPFSSTTTHLEVIQNFLGEEESTIFTLESTTSGRSISQFSAMPTEAEILIPPGTRFEIISILSLGKVKIIQMKQIPTLERMLQFEV
uniref:NAD(P)(+)--arginine ADP-ribosyltransferase n=1 Tax=Arcella intermedia TaxID=1963864 RepID=A0A6B2L407_9EUKA